MEHIYSTAICCRGEYFVFRWRLSQRVQLLRWIGHLAADKDSAFSWTAAGQVAAEVRDVQFQDWITG